MPHVRLRATQADEHLFDYLREDLLDLVFFARQDSTQIFILRRFSPRRTSVWCGADILSLNVLRLLGPLNAKILKPSAGAHQCPARPLPCSQ